MKFYQLTFVFILCLVLSSCEKNESLYKELVDGTQLHKVLIEGEVYQEFTYNEAGLILEEKSKFHYSKHSYNKINQLIQSDHYWDESIASSSSYVLDEAMKRTEWISPDNSERDTYSTLKYDNSGRLEKITTHRLGNDSESYSTYSYNQEGRIDKRTSYHENKISMYEKYFYDAFDNLIKTERYNGSDQLQTTVEYEFDNHPNPYISFRSLMTPGKYTNMNNIVKETYTIYFEVDDSIDKIQVTEYNYEYNTKGYPIRMLNSWEFIYY